MIQFSIYKKEGKKALTIQVLVFGVLFVAAYLLFPVIDSSIFILIAISFGVFIFIKDAKNTPIGKIHFSHHYISIETENANTQISLAKVQRLELVYSGHKGKRVLGDFIPNYNTFSGTDNYIIILINQKKYEYKFLVEDNSQEEEILDLIRDWGRWGYDISHISVNK